LQQEGSQLKCKLLFVTFFLTYLLKIYYNRIIVIKLKQLMEGKGYKHETNRYGCEGNKFIIKFNFIEILSKDWKITTFSCFIWFS